MFTNSKVVDIKNNLSIMVISLFINIRTEIINFIINFISVLFYLVIFATILNKQVTNYIEFLLPGLIIINMLSAVSYQGLKIWSLGSTSKLMAYWFSLPYSLEFQLISFSCMAVFSALLYSLPLIFIGILLGFTINLQICIVIILLGSLFLFFMNLLLVLFFFKTNSFVIIFNVSQPLMLRISPVFYPLIYLPIFALPLSILNPITWMVQSLRGEWSLILSLLLFIVLNIICYKILISYWKKKILSGELI